MTIARKLIQRLLHPRDAIYNLLHLIDAPAHYSKILDLRDLVLMLPDRYAVNLKEELAYVESVSLECLIRQPFPYQRVCDGAESYGGFDAERKLPYVEHKGNRLYFPACDTVDSAKDQYLNLRDVEGITGEGCLQKSPHCYQSADFCVEEGDVVLDIGCAEALFAFDLVDKAKELLLFESDCKWFKPVEATFAPFAGKVKFFPKFVGARTSDNSITLSDAVPRCNDVTYFIKMDIEGGERDVIDSSRDFLMRNRVKLACCVYHRQDDEQYICRRLQEYGYRYSFSDGYMLTSCNGLHAPFFRHGIVYATNID